MAQAASLERISSSGIPKTCFDVLLGSFKEHQPRAAWMGLGMFGRLGVVPVLVASGLTW